MHHRVSELGRNSQHSSKDPGPTPTSAKYLSINFAGSKENRPDSKGGTDEKSSSTGE